MSTDERLIRMSIIIIKDPVIPGTAQRECVFSQV